MSHGGRFGLGLLLLVVMATACGGSSGSAAAQPDAYRLPSAPKGATVKGVSADGKVVSLEIERTSCQTVTASGSVETGDVVTLNVIRQASDSSLPCNAALRIGTVEFRLRSPIAGRRLVIKLST